jgi:hypothetical protein
VFTARAVQGGSFAITDTLSGGTFTGSETLAGTVSRGDGRAALFNFTPTWVDPTTRQIGITLSSDDLDAIGTGSYFINAGVVGGPIVSIGVLHIVAGMSTGTGLRSLVTPSEAVAIIPDILVNPDQFDALPGLLADATTMMEVECERTLVLTNFDGIWPQSAYGYTRTIELEYPVADITKVQTQAVEAIRLQCITGERASVRIVPTSPTSRQIASVVLSRTVSGVPATPVTITLASYATLAQLQAALQVAGWTATSTAGYDAYPATELVNVASTGANTIGLGPNQTVGLWLFDGSHTDYEVTKKGVLRIQAAGTWTDDRTQSVQGRRFSGVRVVYRGGYAIEPADVAAGYEPAPGDLKKAAVMIGRSIQESALTASPVIQQSVSGRSYSKTGTSGVIPPEAMSILRNYKRVWGAA